MDDDNMSGMAKQLKYIPKLNVFYDVENDAYYTDKGFKIDPTIHNKRASDRSEREMAPDVNIERIRIVEDTDDKLSMDSLSVAPSDVIKIIAFVIAVVSQYYIMESKITAVEYKLENLKTAVDDKSAMISELSSDIKKLNAEIAVQTSMMDSLHFKFAEISNNTSKSKK